MTEPSDPSDPIALIRARIEELERSLEERGEELRATRKEIASLKNEVWRAAQASISPAARLAPEPPSAPPFLPPPAPTPAPTPTPESERKPAPEPVRAPAPPLVPVPDRLDSRTASTPLKFGARRGVAPPAPEMDLETRIGTLWLRRVGLVVLVIGVVFFGTYIHRDLHPWHKVTACYALAGGLAALGTFLERRVGAFGRALTAGGLAIAFFTSYAAHFCPPMACMGLFPALALMSLSVVAILLAAERWRSEPAAMLAIFLGHAASFVASGEADVFSVVAILFLSAAGVALFLRHDWLPLSLFTVIAAFASHFVWSLRADSSGSTPETKLLIPISFLTSYYALFLASDSPGRIALLAAALVCLGGGMIASLRHAGRGRYVSPAAAVVNLFCNAIIVVCAIALYATV